MSDAPCPNFLLDWDTDEPGDVPCGDEGHVCDACMEAKDAEMRAYFGIRPGMTREERLDALERMRPAGVPSEEERAALKEAGRPYER